MPDELLQRLRRFREDAFPRYRVQFQALVDEGQHPTTLFIGCSDSRLVPYLLTGTGPGDLFMVRNVGALVPPCCGTADGGHHGTAAAIEFAVLQLKVARIVVCGHTHCGAMRGLLDPGGLDELPAVKGWLQHAELTRRLVQENYPHIEGEDRLTITVEENVLAQIENLRTHPTVRARLARGELSIYAWVFKIETGQVYQFEHSSGQFGPICEAAPPSALPETTVYRRAV